MCVSVSLKMHTLAPIPQTQTVKNCSQNIRNVQQTGQIKYIYERNVNSVIDWHPILGVWAWGTPRDLSKGLSGR